MIKCQFWVGVCGKIQLICCSRVQINANHVVTYVNTRTRNTRSITTKFCKYYWIYSNCIYFNRRDVTIQISCSLNIYLIFITTSIYIYSCGICIKPICHIIGSNKIINIRIARCSCSGGCGGGYRVYSITQIGI